MKNTMLLQKVLLLPNMCWLMSTNPMAGATMLFLLISGEIKRTKGRPKINSLTN